jgi:hypothetical protein
MSLTDLSIQTGVTLTPSGGTAVNFSPSSRTVTNGKHLIVAAVTDFRVRPGLTVKIKEPTLLPDGSFSKGKVSMTLVEPMIDSFGKTQYNLIRIEREVHPELDAADAVDLLKKGAQLCVDSDTTDVWASGSLA